jgi:hypothetical protein
MLGSLGPARREHFKLSSNDQLLNPTTNAAAMYSISLHGGNFSPWSTYTNGSYQKFMSNPVSGTKADSESAWSKFLHWDPLGVDKGIHKVVDPVLDAAGATAAALGNLVEFIGKTAVWISDAKNWVRIAYVTGGSVVVVGGIVMVLRSSSTGQAAIKTAKRIKP